METTVELNEWLTTEDAEKILTKAILANATTTGRELTHRVVAYAYEQGRLDERNK